MAPNRNSVDRDHGRTRETKPSPSWLTSIIPQSLADKAPASTESPHDPSQDYLLGVRGCLAIMSFLWAFMQTFLPATVAHSADETGPEWQLILRKTLSVIFWNDSLIYSSIIFLSARTICIPFLLEPSKISLASSVFRRGIRLWLPVAVVLIVCYAIFTKTLGTQYLYDFKSKTANAAMHADIYQLPDSLANFNAIFDIFWVTHTLSYQAGSWAFPTQTLWIVSALFQQSYTVFAAMVVIPFTRQTWRLWGASLFVLTAWWTYSWAWFSITGLVFADLLLNMDLRTKTQTYRAGFVFIAVLCLLAGYFMMFFWVSARPDLQYAEINFHTGPYNTGGIYNTNDITAPQLRGDDYLVIVGFHLLLETTPLLQMVFANPVLQFVGSRSYSYFLVQSIIIYTLGIQAAVATAGVNLESYASATGIAFALCLVVTVAAGELFYWTFDWPSQRAGKMLFTWIRE